MHDVLKSAAAMMLVAILAGLFIVFTHASTAGGGGVIQPSARSADAAVGPDSTAPARPDSPKTAAQGAK